MKITITPTLIEGVECYTIAQFAALTNRSQTTIYDLTRKGNSKRKLRTVRFLERVFIPKEEYTDFPFMPPGRNSNAEPFHFAIKEE